MLRIALLNRKPGTGKTTSTVWLAHAFVELGKSVLMIDADPAGSGREWADRAAASGSPFPFKVAALPRRDVADQIPGLARDSEIVIVDVPQVEDNALIAQSVLSTADEIVIPMAPTPIEINRILMVRDLIAIASTKRKTMPRYCVLLNRTVHNALSTTEVRELLPTIGLVALPTAVARRELYSQSWGWPVYASGTEFMDVARDLLERDSNATT